MKENDHLQDALRCLVNGISLMRTKPVPPTPYLESQRHYGKNSLDGVSRGIKIFWMIFGQQSWALNGFER